MFYQIFHPPQVKQNMIISTKDGTYELPHELPNNLTPTISGNEKISEKSQNHTEWELSVRTSSQNKTFVNINTKITKK